MPFPHTKMFPLESPVMVSPFSAKVTHNTNLGFSCFCKKCKKTHSVSFNFVTSPLNVPIKGAQSTTQAAMIESAPSYHLMVLIEHGEDGLMSHLKESLLLD